MREFQYPFQKTGPGFDVYSRVGDVVISHIFLKKKSPIIPRKYIEKYYRVHTGKAMLNSSAFQGLYMTLLQFSRNMCL